MKALGFLPEFKRQSVPRLLQIMAHHRDDRVRLESASSLARLNVEEGWSRIGFVATSAKERVELRMESALILAEFQRDEALQNPWRFGPQPVKPARASCGRCGNGLISDGHP